MADAAPAVRPREVPQDEDTRVRIREGALAYARRAGLVPPLDLEALRAAAARFARGNGVAAEHVDFATVALSNAAWADTLAAVPYERRLLPLPRCLRAPDRCRAPIDAVGLQCLRCGNCAVSGLATEAERLGYHVVVAEGTSSVGQLVASGCIEGVVAVACLDSLERSFAAATAGAVPSLAIPLLDDGCRATHVDLAWVRSGLRLRRPGSGFRHFHLERLRQSVARWFTRDSLAELLGGDGTDCERLAIGVLASSGKRWRPTLAAAACQALRGRDDEPAAGVRRIAVAVECFHKASLVHDDIEDGDLERSGEPTLHQAQGIPVALNVGDLLIGEGYRLIAEAGLREDLARRMVATAARAQRELCLGQGAELSWLREPQALGRDGALTLLRRKTAPAFEVSLLLGALLAGADEETCTALSRLSAALGLAYQIRDDIEDAADPASFARPSPLVVALALEQAGDGGLRLLRGQSDARERLELVARVQGEAWSLFEHYRAEGLRALRPLASQPLKGLLFRLVSLFLGTPRVAGPSEGAADAR